MQSSSLKVSWIILFILACILLIMSLSFLFLPGLFLNSDFQVYVGQEFDDFEKGNSLLAHYLYIIVRQFAIANLIIGIYSIGIILSAYRRGST